MVDNDKNVIKYLLEESTKINTEVEKIMGIQI